jgi:hypothetical protein
MSKNFDIRLSIGFWDHPKTGRLIRRLGLQGAISLQILWLWSTQHRPDGVLSGLDAEDIEFAARWLPQYTDDVRRKNVVPTTVHTSVGTNVHAMNNGEITHQATPMHAVCANANTDTSGVILGFTNAENKAAINSSTQTYVSESTGSSLTDGISTLIDGVPSLFVETLLKCKFLDIKDNQFILHGWAEHNTWQADVDTRSGRNRFSRLGRLFKGVDATHNVYELLKKHGISSISEDEYKTVRSLYDEGTDAHTVVATVFTKRTTPIPIPIPIPNHNKKEHTSYVLAPRSDEHGASATPTSKNSSSSASKVSIANEMHPPIDSTPTDKRKGNPDERAEGQMQIPLKEKAADVGVNEQGVEKVSNCTDSLSVTFKGNPEESASAELPVELPELPVRGRSIQGDTRLGKVKAYENFKATYVCTYEEALALNKHPPAVGFTHYFLPIISKHGQDVAFIKEKNWRAWVEVFGEDLCSREIAKAYVWCMDNPARRKTANGLAQFLGSWFAKAHNRGQGGGAVYGNYGNTRNLRSEHPGVDRSVDNDVTPPGDIPDDLLMDFKEETS